jgi:phage recombination protein Bet
MSQTGGTAIVARMPKPPAAANISPEHWQILTDVIWPEAKDPNVIATAFNYCLARNLDPFKRPVHIVPVYSRALRRRVETIWPGIGELETTASRSGWAGLEAAKFGPVQTQTFKGVFENDDGSTTTREVTVTFPEWCEVTVYRIVAGEKRAFTETAWWIETYARAGFRSELPNDMWQKRPRGQLAKCVKAMALRAAFPEEGAGPTSEEMAGQEIDGAGPGAGVTIDHEPNPPPRETKPPPAATKPNGGASARREDINREVPMNGAPAGQGQPAATQGQGWKVPEDIPKEYDPAINPRTNDVGWQPPEYPIIEPTGRRVFRNTGSEWLEDWRRGIGLLAHRRSVLVDVQGLNREALAEVAAFDPAAAAEVSEMLRAAIEAPTEGTAS